MSGPPPRKRPEGVAKLLTARHRPGGSCAECKRLKIKCTKAPNDEFPCESCVRRGCPSICPSGRLKAGKAGSRFVLANTEQLHEKITELSTRVRDLEDALQELQANTSAETHPLLSKDLLLVKAPLESDTVLADSDASDHENIDAFGSLSIKGHERTNFHGQGAGAWFYLLNEDSDSEDQADASGAYPLPTDILYASHIFPLGSLDDTRGDLRLRIQTFVPSRDVAQRLVDNYFNGMAWMYDPIPRAQFNDKVFCIVYTAHFPQVGTGDMHALAVLFIVLAIGTLLDLDIPNYSPQATRYYQLSRAALALDLSLDDPSLSAVQALYLMGFFLHMSDTKGGFGTSWALMGLNAKLAIGIGLHRDSAKWKLGGEDDIRRQLFWELYTYDTWQALPCGRPPSFHRMTVDSKMPYTHLLSQNATSDDPSTVFKAWKHRFSYERISPMVEQTFGYRTPAYATIIQLDRKLRQDPVPPILQLGSTLTSQTDGASATLTMQRYAVFCVREITLLLMHRPFFAQAVTEKSPLDAKFAPSVLAVYRSSCSIIIGVRELYNQQPRLAPRVWFFWAHVFSATICLAGLVARCPSSSLTLSALAQVDSACELFGKVTDCYRVTKSLPSMLKLREKAHNAFAQFQSGQDAKPPEAGQQDLELSALVGETRLVSHRIQQLPSPAETIYSNITSPDVPSMTQAQPPACDASQLPMQGYADQANTSTSYNDLDLSGYHLQYPPNGYTDVPTLEQNVLPYAMQDEYQSLQFPYPPNSAEQQVFLQPSAWYDNLVRHLEMDGAT